MITMCQSSLITNVLGFAGICKRGLAGNKTAGRRQEALNISSQQFMGLLFLTSVELY
jgi:hypothetical protein